MVKSWQYPRWRRYAMQAVMWVILGVTIGMAALVNHSRRQMLRVDLAPPITSGNISVRLPATWQIAQPLADDAHATSHVIARATEPATGDDESAGSQAGRTVTIYRDSVDAPISPIHYLIEREGLADALAQPQETQEAVTPAEMLPFTPIDIGGSPGVMIELRTRVNRAPRSPGARETNSAPDVGKVLIACTVLPSRQSIVLKLQSPGESDLGDSEILQQLASAIQIAEEPSRGSSGESISLEGGIRVRMPDGMVPIYDKDPNRSERLAWFEGDARSWVTVELVPCVLLPDGSGDDERRAVATIVASRDRDLSRATISADGPRRWRIDPPATPISQVAPRRLYLLSDDRGDSGQISGGPRRALLAVLYGVPGSELRFDSTWNGIAAGVEFFGETDFASMLAAGEAEAQYLMRKGLTALAEQQPTGEAWWLALNAASKSAVGWSHVTWDAREKDPLGRRRSYFVSNGGTQRTRHTQSWDGALDAYRCLTETTIFDPGGVTLHNELTKLSEGELVSELSQPRRKPITWKRSAPAQYVPGAWLALLIGHLRTDAPLILRTDFLTGFEGISPSEPLALLVTFPKQTDADERPTAANRRIVSIQVNGSGQIMTWHIKPDGSVDRIDLASGARCVLSDEQAVRNDFDNVDDSAQSLR